MTRVSTSALTSIITASGRARVPRARTRSPLARAASRLERVGAEARHAPERQGEAKTGGHDQAVSVHWTWVWTPPQKIREIAAPGSATPVPSAGSAVLVSGDYEERKEIKKTKNKERRTQEQ